MKLTISLIFFAVLTAAAGSSYSQTTRINLKVKDATLVDVFREIERTSEFGFFFKSQELDLNTRVSIELKDAAIEEVLKRILADNYDYRILDKNIVITRGNFNTTEQQQKSVSGKVTDSSGGGLPGVSVVVKGTTTGTITDNNGSYLLANVPANATLQFSFVGMKTQEIEVGGKTTINVTLAEDAIGIEEVVAVGYGTQRKINLSGAVASVKGDVLENRPIANIAQGLQGVIPNLNISFNSGNPNAETKFNIRGATSLNGGNALVLVDGVETDLTVLNSQDIESISVLKDAASAAVYGPRAAFGVILVTTKRGKLNQQVQLNYNNNFSWSTPSRLPKGMAADKWLEATNQAGINNGSGAYFPSDLVTAVKNHIANPSQYPSAFLDETGRFTAKGQWAYAGNTDWFSTLYNNAAYMQQHNFSISGGTDKTTFYGSLGYKGQTGLLAFGTDTYKRYNVAFNFTSQVTNWVQLRFTTKYNGNNSNLPNADFYLGNPYYEVYRAFPFIPLYLPNGDFAGIEGNNFNYNIAGRLALAGRKTTQSDDVWLTGGFHITPLKGWAIKGDYTINKWFNTYREHKKTIYQTMPDPATPKLSTGSPNGVWQYRNSDSYKVFNIWTDYTFNMWKDHNVTLMAGYNQESKMYNRFAGESTSLFANDFPVGGLAKTFKISEDATTWAVKGLFFRMNYDYRSKYLLEVNGRYDGSSKYPVGKQWGFFPSISAGWRVSEEAFYAPIKPYIEHLKFRASYGALGNQITDGNFQYLGYLKSDQFNYAINGQNLTGLIPSTLASSNITWEKVNTLNFGLDFSLLKDRLTSSFDYYIRNTTGMVVTKAYPAVLGSSGGKENLADMRTNGWELALNWHDKVENVGNSTLTYGVGIGLSDNTTVITRYNNPTNSLSDYYVGERIGEIWGYVTDGYILDQAEAVNMATIQGKISRTWLPGDIRYKNLDNDPNITKGDNTLGNPGDQKVIGNNTPRYRFNFSLNAGWHGFDLKAIFEGVGKRDIWLGNNNIFWGYSGIWWMAINDYIVDNSWSPTHTNAYYPVPTFSDRSRQPQTKYLQNGAYVRLRDLTLSYTVPNKVLAKLGVEQLRLFVSGQNLWEATKLYKYLDPDVTGNNKNNGQLNTDGKVYPFSRTYALGLNITL